MSTKCIVCGNDDQEMDLSWKDNVYVGMACTDEAACRLRSIDRLVGDAFPPTETEETEAALESPETEEAYWRRTFDLEKDWVIFRPSDGTFTIRAKFTVLEGMIPSGATGEILSEYTESCGCCSSIFRIGNAENGIVSIDPEFLPPKAAPMVLEPALF